MTIGPHIHKSFEILKSKIVGEYETEEVNKRVGLRTTCIFRCDEVVYNPKFPILTADKVSRWVDNKHVFDVEREASAKQAKEKASSLKTKLKIKKIKKRSHDEKAASITPSSSASYHQQEHCKQDETSLKIAAGPVEEPIASPKGKQDAISDASLVCGDTLDLNSNEEDISDDRQDEKSPNQVAKSDLDALVLNEFEDEYRHLADGDSEEEEESEMSKNLKKIRCEPPKQVNKQTLQHQNLNKANSLQQPQANRQAQQAKQQVNMTNQTQQQNETSQLTTPISEEEREPEWKEVLKKVQESNFEEYRLVYQHLNHFRDKIKSSNDDARSLLKEVVSRCFIKDESFHLLDFLDLVFYFNYNTDHEFMCQIYRKLKRKINPQASVVVFKCKVDTEVVMNNYRLALNRLAQYVVSNDLTLTMKCSEFKQLIDLAYNDNAVKKEEPAESLPLMRNANGHSNSSITDTTPGSHGTGSTNSNESTYYSCLEHENDRAMADQQPSDHKSTKVQRIVEPHINPIDGSKCFKVISRRKVIAGCELRKRL